MKKILLILLALVLVVGLCACTDDPTGQSSTPPVSPGPSDTEPGSTSEPGNTSGPDVTGPGGDPSPSPSTAVAPAGTVVCGVDLSGMTRDEALAALNAACEGYVLALDVSGTSLTISARDAGLALDQATFDTLWQALEEGGPLPDFHFIADRAALEKILSARLETPARNATLGYNSTQKRFVITAGSNGVDYDISLLAGQVASSMCALQPTRSVSAEARSVTPTVPADDPRLAAAMDKANGYLDLVLVYTFTTKTGGTISETFLRDTVAPMIRIDQNYNVSISRTVVEQKVSAVAARHSDSTRTEYFVATDGRSIPYAVTYYSRQVDISAMTEDLYTCLITGVSGQRTAPYLTPEQAALPFGGSYIEIDLTAQRLWVYKGGVCVVDTPIVSGCVANNNHTPTGVYAIYKKVEDCWLVGPTWRDYVDYWMPFYGSYGLHDASWRSEFGGEIYIHEGSHGCPNLPVEIAGQVYHNISVGTPVVIYGGASAPYDLAQVISGTTVYALSKYDTAFKLDATLKYQGAEVTYISDNPAVASVSADGTVTVHGVGTANITVSAAPFTHHTGASVTVRVNVSPYCREEDHLFGQWTQTAVPGCETVGSEERTCSVCGCVETQEVPAVGHNFVFGSPMCTNGCGAIDPSYLWPPLY